MEASDLQVFKARERKHPTIAACSLTLMFDLLGVNESRARILLDAQEVLLRFGIRHQLIAGADAAAMRAELSRLRGVLEGGRRVQ